ncbi:hypothetical protein C0583_02075 [Candidatus Parcubacteria bacterium]|nr:MAG: hypothetical protein C0583_02075 [Candidatus Parcubacteria bacterium]
MKVKKTKIQIVFRYVYIGFIFANIGIVVYLYFFLMENVNGSINFDESNFPQNLRKNNDIKTEEFNTIIDKINERELKENTTIDNIFAN